MALSEEDKFAQNADAVVVELESALSLEREYVDLDQLIADVEAEVDAKVQF